MDDREKLVKHLRRCIENLFEAAEFATGMEGSNAGMWDGAAKEAAEELERQEKRDVVDAPEAEEKVFVTVEECQNVINNVRVFRSEFDADRAENVWRGEQDVSYEPDDIEDREDAFESLADTGTAFHMKESHIE